MANSYISSYVHYIFSTKNREKHLTKELTERLYPYIGGIARENKMKMLTIGGVVDHLHLLLSLPATITIAKAIQQIKGASSKWIHETFPELKYFSWQEGYGAFSISFSQIEEMKHYIQNQEDHHRIKTFKEEYIEILEQHGIEYDERYLL